MEYLFSVVAQIVGRCFSCYKPKKHSYTGGLLTPRMVMDSNSNPYEICIKIE